MKATIGKVWAICDHFEQNTGKPALASTLKQATGIDRKQLRKWVREGRLVEYTITSGDGQQQNAYSRPKVERGIPHESTLVSKEGQQAGEEEVH